MSRRGTTSTAKRAAWLAIPAVLLLASSAEARDTHHCEREVTEYCVQETCPDFCEAINPDEDEHAPAVAACKAHCTPEAWCKEVPLKGHGEPGHEELDDENRHELMACIAEEYDPGGEKTGRDTSATWKKSHADTWEKKVLPKAARGAPTVPAVPPPSRGCACELGDARSDAKGWAFVAMAALAALRRRRVRR